MSRKLRLAYPTMREIARTMVITKYWGFTNLLNRVKSNMVKNSDAMSSFSLLSRFIQ